MRAINIGAGSAGAGADGAAGEIPDMDEIPDMEEDGLEEVEDEATAVPPPKATAPAASGVIDAT